MKVPTPADLLKAAGAQTEAMMALPGLLLQLTAQVRLLTDTLSGINRVVQHVDDLLTEVEPGLRNLAQVLENPVIETIPDTIREVQESVIPALLRVKQLVDSTARMPGAGLITGRSRRSEVDRGV